MGSYLNERNKKISIAFLLGGILLAAALARFSAIGFSYTHPDEVIAVEVAEQIVESGSLNTNWKLADLPSHFKYPQYNFSGYLISSAIVLSFAESVWGDIDERFVLRAFSTMLALASILLLYLLGKRVHGETVGLFAAFMASFAVLLYQDSLYARPETFVAALFLFNLLLSERKQLSGKAFFLSSIIWGVLVSTKLSFVALAPIAFLPPIERKIKQGASYRLALWSYCLSTLANVKQRLVMFIIGGVAGFMLGAPYVPFNFSDYLNGISVLTAQYSGGHWPHGLYDGSILERLIFAGDYFLYTIGGVFVVLGFVGVLQIFWIRNFRWIAIFCLAAIFFLRFATYPAFFERNLSHLVPIFLLFSAIGLTCAASVVAKHGWIRIATALLLLFSGSLRSGAIVSDMRFIAVPGSQKARIQTVKKHIKEDYHTPIYRLAWQQLMPGRNTVTERYLGNRCGSVLVQFPWAKDRYSARSLERLQTVYGFEMIAKVPSIFHDVPTSTLHVYFTPTYYFLYRPSSNTDACSARNSLVYTGPIGAALPVRVVDLDAGWTKKGAYPGTSGGSAGLYYGSWSGSDANKGSASLLIHRNCEAVIIPYLTGPVVDRQSIQVTGLSTGEEVLSVSNVYAEASWRYLKVPVSESCDDLLVEFRDDGAHWGEWSAFGMPRGIGEKQQLAEGIEQQYSGGQ